jgi:hypothetical protein
LVEAAPQAARRSLAEKIKAKARKGKAFPQGRVAEPHEPIKRNVETPSREQTRGGKSGSKLPHSKAALFVGRCGGQAVEHFS